MSEDATISRKSRTLLGDQDKNCYSATEELNLEDFEAVAKAVLRQRKISVTVSNHLTPQFAEYDERAQNEQTISATQQPAANQVSSQANTQTSKQVSIDSEVFDSILIGLSQLVDSQRRFADEFGLKQDLVFSSDIKDMQKRGTTTVLHEWMKGQDQGASSKLDALLEDLTHHQVSLLATLDTISRRTIKYLGPELTRKSVHGLAKFGPMWPHYKERNKKLSTDQYSRYKIIIAPGIAYGYVKAKEKFIKKKVE